MYCLCSNWLKSDRLVRTQRTEIDIYPTKRGGADLVVLSLERPGKGEPPQVLRIELAPKAAQEIIDGLQRSLTGLARGEG